MKLKSLLIITASSLLLASCLKSRDSLGVHGDSGSIVSEIWDVNYYGDPKVIALNATPAQETVNDFLTLRTYAARSKQPSGGKVHVKLALDNSAVTAAGLTPLPTNAYSIPSLEFDVPANGEVQVPFTLNKTALDLSQTYGIGFNISSVSDGVASDLAKSTVVALIIKNAYHADYHVTGFFFHPSSPRPIDMVKSLSTLGAQRCLAQVLGDLSGWQFAFDVSGTNTLTNWAAAGSTPAAPQSGFMTADNPGGVGYPGPELPGTAPYVQSTYNNTYDPTTKTFWMHYGYAGGATGQNGYTRQIYEKWVRQ